MIKVVDSVSALPGSFVSRGYTRKVFALQLAGWARLGGAKFLTLLPAVGQWASRRKDEIWVFFLLALTVLQFTLSVPGQYEPTFGKRYSKVLLHWIINNIF